MYWFVDHVLRLVSNQVRGKDKRNPSVMPSEWLRSSKHGKQGGPALSFNFSVSPAFLAADHLDQVWSVSWNPETPESAYQQ